MSTQLENIYTYLVGNRKAVRVGWYDHYKQFTDDVQTIANALESDKDIAKPETYTGTSFENIDKPPYEAFIEKLLFEYSNGVSSRGQSVLSRNDLQKFLAPDNVAFQNIITELITNPNKESNEKFRTFWQESVGQNNPVLTNRAIAACTRDVSSTVDESKFNQVFAWLQNEKLIPEYTAQEQDWYAKNVFLIEALRKGLAGIEKDPIWINILIWEMYANLANPFSLKKQIVKYGAPGTGKTFLSMQTGKLQFDIWASKFDNHGLKYEEVIETVQFHPSYSYEDFIEGLRPKLDNNGVAQLQLQNGVFKNFCIKAGKWETDVYNAKITDKPKYNEITLQDIADNKNSFTGEHWKYIHQIEDKDLKLKDVVPPFFMLIDEINRAELSRVLGELMRCLEYRGVDGSIKTQYAQLNTDATGMLKIADSYQFYIPHNVYILATMNTIDRSVESFDFALRRRFRWEEVNPDIQALRYHLITYNSKWTGLADSLKKLNESIENEVLLGKDYCIGHAYLWDLPYSKDITINEVKKLIWDDSIHSLLHEYLRGTGKEELIDQFKKDFGIR